jgi:putative alpha-1,2-mannosidase
METPYSYAWAGRADRVQQVVDAVKTYSYAPGRGGLAGNDDSGGEAAWYPDRGKKKKKKEKKKIKK